MTARHRPRGPEHASWVWAVQLLAVVAVLGLLYVGLGLLFGWW